MTEAIILSTARTGSTLLLTQLHEHPNIKAFGELFCFDMLKEEILDFAVSDPLGYYSETIKKVDKKVIVFKLFYDHLTKDYFNDIVPLLISSNRYRNRVQKFRNYFNEYHRQELAFEGWKNALQHFVEKKSIKIIHLRRFNKLASLVSLKTACINDSWRLLRGQKQELTQVQLSFDECLEYFEKLENWEMEYSTLFQNHENIDIEYEMLVSDRIGEMAKIYKFLRLPDFRNSDSPVIEKQNHVPLSKVVLNFTELMHQFRKTKWEKFFIEESNI